MQRPPLRTHSRIDTFLTQALTTLIPLLFLPALLIAGTVIYSYSYARSVALPRAFALGIIITFSALILVTAGLHAAVHVRGFRRERAAAAVHAAGDADVEWYGREPEKRPASKLYIPSQGPRARSFRAEAQPPAQTHPAAESGAHGPAGGAEEDARTATPDLKSAGWSPSEELHGFQTSPSQFGWSFSPLGHVSEESFREGHEGDGHEGDQAESAAPGSCDTNPPPSPPSADNFALPVPRPPFIFQGRTPAPPSSDTIIPPPPRVHFRVPGRFPVRVSKPPSADTSVPTVPRSSDAVPPPAPTSADTFVPPPSRAQFKSPAWAPTPYPGSQAAAGQAPLQRHARQIALWRAWRAERANSFPPRSHPSFGG